MPIAYAAVKSTSPDSELTDSRRTHPVAVHVAEVRQFVLRYVLSVVRDCWIQVWQEG